MQPHRFGVDRDRAWSENAFRQILFVEMNRHGARIGGSR